MSPDISAPQENLHRKVSDLKRRLSTKKIEASILFSDIIAENKEEHRMKGQLEIIRDVLKKQQENEGTIKKPENLH